MQGWGLGGGGGQTARLAGLQIVFPRPPRLSLWVDLQWLLARPCSSPRGLSAGNAMLLLRRMLESVCSGRVLRAPTHSPPPASPEPRDRRRQARRNHSLRYAGQTWQPLPLQSFTRASVAAGMSSVSGERERERDTIPSIPL